MLSGYGLSDAETPLAFVYESLSAGQISRFPSRLRMLCPPMAV